MLEDALPNLSATPALLQGGQPGPRADLTHELEELKRRELPVVVLWGDAGRHHPEGVVRRALCCAVGAEGQVVDGSHSWLLADPDGFGEVMTNAVEVARVAPTSSETRRLRAELASSARTGERVAHAAHRGRRQAFGRDLERAPTRGRQARRAGGARAMRRSPGAG